MRNREQEAAHRAFKHLEIAYELRHEEAKDAEPQRLRSWLMTREEIEATSNYDLTLIAHNLFGGGNFPPSKNREELIEFILSNDKGFD